MVNVRMTVVGGKHKCDYAYCQEKDPGYVIVLR